MDSMEDKLGSILNDPKMMQQIMSLAQSLGQNKRKVSMVIRMLFVASANTHFSSPRLTLLSAASSANSREKCLRPKQGTILQEEQLATWLQVGHSGSVLSQRTRDSSSLHVDFTC